MKRKSLIFCLIVVMLINVGLLGGCNNNNAEKDKVYIINSDTHYPPFGYFDTELNKYVGLDVDLLEAIAEDQSFRYELKHDGFSAAMGAVQAGQADGMIAAMTITEVRKETYDFSDSYFLTGLIFFTSAGSDIQGYKDLSGKVIAAKIGTIGTAIAENVAKEYGAEVLYFEDTPTMFNTITQGNAVAGFEDAPQVLWAIKNGLQLQTVGELIDPGDYGLAVKKGQHPELIKMFNEGLKHLKENGKYDEILSKWGMD